MPDSQKEFYQRCQLEQSWLQYEYVYDNNQPGWYKSKLIKANNKQFNSTKQTREPAFTNFVGSLNLKDWPVNIDSENKLKRVERTLTKKRFACVYSPTFRSDLYKFGYVIL